MASSTSASIFTADIGTGSAASGSKNTGSLRPQSRPNFLRKRWRWASRIARVRSVIATLVTRSFLPGLRRRLLGMAVGPYPGFRVPTPDQVGCRERVSADVQANNLVDGPKCDGGNLH